MPKLLGPVLILLLGIVLFPLARQDNAGQTSTEQSPPVLTSRNDRVLMVLQTQAGLRVSQNGGKSWLAHLSGLPAPAMFYDIVADPRQVGTAFATNGPVYRTTDSGTSWTLLPAAPVDAAGLATLTVDSTGGALYGGGSTIVRFDQATGRWTQWGRNWPQGSHAQLLLSVPQRGLFALAGSRLLHAATADDSWAQLAVPAWQGAAATAMALGPDGSTVYVAVARHGIWSLDRSDHAAQVPMSILPSDATVNAMSVDVAGNDLYVAAGNGLYVRHLIAYALQRQVASFDAGSTVTVLRPFCGGLIAVASNGQTAIGHHAAGQALNWSGQATRCTASIRGRVVDLLTSEEWRPAVPVQLPPAFATCQTAGDPAASVTYDVCGPFWQFYVQNHAVTGYPLEKATYVNLDTVGQTFANVRLLWTPRRGVYLDELGARVVRMFAHPFPPVRGSPPYYTIWSPDHRHYIEQVFLAFWAQWLDQSGKSIFGPPISQGWKLPSLDGSGVCVQVQYFQNARLEYHADQPPGSQIEVSPLGQAVKNRWTIPNQSCG